MSNFPETTRTFDPVTYFPQPSDRPASAKFRQLVQQLINRDDALYDESYTTLQGEIDTFAGNFDNLVKALVSGAQRDLNLGAMVPTTSTWQFNTDGIWIQTVATTTDQTGLIGQFDFSGVNAVTTQYIESVNMWVVGSQSDSAVPGTTPTFELKGIGTNGGVSSLCSGTDSSTNVLDYKTAHRIFFVFSAGTAPAIEDFTRYVLTVSGESGTNSNTGMKLVFAYATLRINA